MGWLTLLDGQLVLSLLIPALAAAVLVLVEAKGPLSGTIRRTVGVVPPYVAAITVLFGLFTTRLVNDVWEKDNVARQSVQLEDDALRGLLHMADTTGLRAALLPPAKDYAAAASKENPYSRALKSARDDTDKAYVKRLSAVSAARVPDNATKVTLLTTVNDLRRARDRRLYVADDETAVVKWISILFLGILTQVTIVLVHSGNQRAMRAALGIFTIAFTFCIVIVAIFDQPFEALLADEPGATLAHFATKS